jgi:hypothetical protein
MISTIHDLQGQVDTLQSKCANSPTADQERNNLLARVRDLQAQVATLQSKYANSPTADARIRDLQAQVDDMNKKYVDEHEYAAKLVSEVDETNSALDEVRSGLEREMELRKESENENKVLQNMFEDEVRQWRAKELEWERERADLKEQGYVFCSPFSLSLSLSFSLSLSLSLSLSRLTPLSVSLLSLPSLLRLTIILDWISLNKQQSCKPWRRH